VGPGPAIGPEGPWAMENRKDKGPGIHGSEEWAWGCVGPMGLGPGMPGEPREWPGPGELWYQGWEQGSCVCRWGGGKWFGQYRIQGNRLFFIHVQADVVTQSTSTPPKKSASAPLPHLGEDARRGMVNHPLSNEHTPGPRNVPEQTPADHRDRLESTGGQSYKLRQITRTDWSL
jgi:hypothetical protein